MRNKQPLHFILLKADGYAFKLGLELFENKEIAYIWELGVIIRTIETR